MCTHGGMKLSSDILGYPCASSSLVRAVVGFMRNLCADDLRKENLGKLTFRVLNMNDVIIKFINIQLINFNRYCMLCSVRRFHGTDGCGNEREKVF